MWGFEEKSGGVQRAPLPSFLVRIIIFMSCKLQDRRGDNVDRVLGEETVALLRPGFAKGG